METEKNIEKKICFSSKKSMDTLQKITGCTQTGFQHFVENLAEQRKRLEKQVDFSRVINIFNRVFNGGLRKKTERKELQKVYPPCT